MNRADLVATDGNRSPDFVAVSDNSAPEISNATEDSVACASLTAMQEIVQDCIGGTTTLLQCNCSQSYSISLQGVKITVLDEFLQHCIEKAEGGSTKVDSMTTEEINISFQKKLTCDAKESYCDYIKKIDSTNTKVGKGMLYHVE